MAQIRNVNAPASAPGGYTWDDPEQVVEVPDALAEQLLKLPHGGWREVLPEGEKDADAAEAVGPEHLPPCARCAGTGVEPMAGGFIHPVPIGGVVRVAPGSLAGALTEQPDMRANTVVTADGQTVILSHDGTVTTSISAVEIEAQRNADDADEADTEQGDEPYDPDGLSDDDVLDYLRSDQADEAEVNRVMDLAAGKSGRARRSLTAHREELLAAKRQRTEPVTE
jgi:hypothetical protein